MDLRGNRLLGWEVGGIFSGLCPVTGFGIKYVETFGPGVLCEHKQ